MGDPELARLGKPILKCLYKEHPEVASMSQAKVEEIYKTHSIAVEGSEMKPVTEFRHTGLPETMLYATRDFVRPSPIQSQVDT